MVQITSIVNNNILYTIASGTLTPEDYDRFLPVAKEKIAQYGKVRWYFELENFEGWEAGALWKDLKFDVQRFNDIEKLAVVGEKNLHEIMTKFLKPFTAAEVRYFDVSQKEEAKAWIKI